MWRTETRKRVTKRETKKSRLVSLPVCGKVCWESRCLWFRQVSNSGNSQINSQEFKESKKLTIERVNDWFFVYSLSLVFAHLCLTLLDFRRVFVTATVFFSFAPKDASFWRPLSVLQYLHGVQWWTARCWMESDVLPHPHDPGKERKGMKGDGTACHESERWVFGVEMYRCHDAITTMTCFHLRSRSLSVYTVMYTVSYTSSTARGGAGSFKKVKYI